MILPSKNSKKTEGTEAIGRNTTVVVVDEFGELGNGPRRKSKFFGYAVSITRKASAFAGATLSNRRRFPGREVKAYEDTAEGRRKVLQEVSDIGADTRAYYVDKDRLPRGWGKKMKKCVQESGPRWLSRLVADPYSRLGPILGISPTGLRWLSHTVADPYSRLDLHNNISRSDIKIIVQKGALRWIQ